MMDIIAGIVNSTHYVGQAVDANTIKAEKSFEEDYKKRVDQIRRVEQVKAISNLSSLSNQNQQAKAQEFFRTEMIVDDKGKSTRVILTSNRGFRQINLDGTRMQDDEKLINPAKVKAAYFND